MRNHLIIGELAEQMNLNPRTLRYYESIGLLIPSARAANGYRIYTEEDASKLRFIIRAKRFGLSLEEIKLLLHPAQQGLCETVQDHTRAFLSRKIEEINQRIVELELLKEDLAHYLKELQDQKIQPPGTFSGCHCL